MKLVSGKLCEMVYVNGTRSTVRYLAKLYNPWVVYDLVQKRILFIPEESVESLTSLDTNGTHLGYIVMPDLAKDKYYSIRDPFHDDARQRRRLVKFVGVEERGLFLFQEVRSSCVVPLRYLEGVGWMQASKLVTLGRSRKPHESQLTPSANSMIC
jgi:hypothetical protein